MQRHGMKDLLGISVHHVLIEKAHVITTAFKDSTYSSSIELLCQLIYREYISTVFP